MGHLLSWASLSNDSWPWSRGEEAHREEVEVELEVEELTRLRRLWWEWNCLM